MVKLQINEQQAFDYNENEELQLIELYKADLSDFETYQLYKALTTVYNNEQYVKVEITDYNVFILLKTADGREFLDNVLYREVVTLRSAHVTGVLSTTEATDENGFEVNLL